MFLNSTLCQKSRRYGILLSLYLIFEHFERRFSYENFSGLRKVLEEMEKGNDVRIADVAQFIRELESDDLSSDEEIELEQKLEEEIKHTLKLQHSKLT